MDHLLSEYKRGLLTTDQVLALLRGQAQPDLTAQHAASSTDFPLTEGQRGLWWLQKLNPDSAAYNVPIALQFAGEIQPDVVQCALDGITADHPALTTRFLEVDGQPRQIEGAYSGVALQYLDLSASRDDTVLAALRLLAKQPFRVDREPLVRAWLGRQPNGGCILLLVIHHLVCDGRSVHLLLTNLLARLRALQDGGDLPIVQTTPFSEFVAAQSEFQGSDAGQRDLAYWRLQLEAPLPVLELPTDYARHLSTRAKGCTSTLSLDAELGSRVRQLARDIGVSPSVVMLGAFQLLLSRYTNQRDVIVGMPTMGRSDMRFEKTVGYFVNMVSVRAHLDFENELPQFLQNLQLTLADAIDHSGYPFAALVRDLRVPRSSEHPPVFQVAFEYLNDSVMRVADLSDVGQGLCCESINGLHQEGEYELTLEVHEHGRHFDLHWKYDPELFQADTVRRLSAHYCTLLGGFFSRPQQTLRQFSLLSSAESQRILIEWNATQVEAPQLCVHELFTEQAKRTPDAVAVRFEDESLTYRELDQRSDVLARYLQVQGIGPDALVGVCLDRSLDMVVALVGVLRAGGAYVPLDPHYPIDRLQHMLVDSGASLLLTEAKHIDRLKSVLPQSLKTARMDDWPTVVELGTCVSQRNDAVTLQNLAYVIYTSGSTGRPKGVMIEHRALSNFLLSMASRPGLTSQDCLLAVTTYSFDIAGLEIFLPLIVGAQCCIASSERTRDPAQLSREIARVQPTVMQATPATWTLLFQSGWRNESGVKALCGGEPLPQALKQQFIDTGTVAWNMFGPTETTIWSTMAKVEAEGPTTIGYPIANTTVYVLDEEMQPVPIGVSGELYIGGLGLARGYLNRSELTSERFVSHPQSQGERLYRTGDLARWRADGQIEHLGRMDTQVKLRGYRIELGEIEAVLARHAGIEHCAVVLHEDDDRKQLVAYYVASDGAVPVNDLRSHLRASLPEFMLPARYVALSALPLSPAGKIDRLTLSKRPLVDGDSVPSNLHAPQAEVRRGRSGIGSTEALQKQILAIWRETLRNPQADLDEGFFDGGGDSLLASTVAQRISTALECDFSVTDLFKHGTVRQISQHLGKVLASRPTSSQFEPVSVPTQASVALTDIDDDLAIIGISCQFPGAADHRAFWANLRDGVESVRILSGEALLDLGIEDDLVRHPSLVPVQSTIEGKDHFDPAFFKISPRDAELMDPQARLLLQNAWKALEDSGHIAADMPETGVFMALSNSRYNAPDSTHDASYVMRRTDEYLSWVLAQGGTVPTLVSHKLGLKGPSYAVHSNCSSSLVALYAAQQAIHAGDARAALVGAATFFPGDSLGYVHQNGMNFSSDGHVRTFDASANGMIAGEGVAVIVVKRVRDAVADGDHIYAVIRGLALNNDGADKAGFYAPSVQGQSAVIEKALRTSGVHPESINYIEAHGTGTSLGDPIEFSALREVYRRYTDRTGYCGLGSVKTNLGHLDTAAGLAGCIKVALSLEHRALPPTLNYKEINPRMPLDGSPFYINDHLRAWPETEGPRRAAVSSFGIGGTNAHVIFEQAPVLSAEGSVDERECLGLTVVPLSARSMDRLQAVAGNLLAFLRNDAPSVFSMASLAFTLQVGREAMGHRVAFLVSSREELLERLAAFCAGKSQVPDCVQGEAGSSSTLAEWFDGEDSAVLIDRWVEEQSYSKLARAWVGGMQVNWHQLYGQTHPRRMSLPTYPFAPERYRLPKRIATAELSAQEATKLHPMVHRNTSHIGQQRFASTFTGQEFFLRDHIVQQQKVLPGVAYLEMARAAVELAADPAWLEGTEGHLVIGLEHVVFARPLVVGAKPVELQLGLNSTERGIEFDISSLGEGGTVLHSQGRAVLSRSQGQPSFVSWIQSALPNKVRMFDADTCYAAFAGLGFAYGPSFQVLSRVWIESASAELPVVRAHVVLPERLDSTRSAFVLHPSLMDGALQACVGLLLSVADGSEVKPALPFAVETVEIFCSLPADAQIRIAFSPGSRPESSVRKLDLEIADGRGVLCARLLGYSSRVLGGQTGSAAALPVVEAGQLYLRPEWVSEPIDASSAAPELAEHRIVICDIGVNDREAQQLVRHLSERYRGAKITNWTAPGLDLAARYSLYAGRLLAVLQDVAQNKATPVLVQLVVPNQSEAACLRGLHGLLQCAAQENRRLTVQTLAVTAGGAFAELAGLLECEAQTMLNREVRFHGAERQVLTFAPVDGISASAPVWKDHGVYLITGGMGGLGRLFVGDIIKHASETRLVLVGRSALTASHQEWLQSFRDQGHQIDYRELDVSDPDAVHVLVREVVSMHGRLDGIVHAAGTLRDAPIVNKSEADLQAVLAPKVAGLSALDRATADLDLDCFLLFSSVAVLQGNQGQSDYAAANAFMDAFAVHREELVRVGARHGRTISINWPLWAAGGMRVDERILARLTLTTGMMPIETDIGLQALHHAYALPGAQVAVLYGEVDRLKMVSKPASRLPEADMGSANSVSPSTQPSQPAQPRDDEASLDAAAVAYVCQLISTGLKLPADRTLDAHAALDQYGIDSIMVTELTGQLETVFGSLPKTLFFEYQTAAELAAYLLESHREALLRVTGRAAVPSQQVEPPKLGHSMPVPGFMPVRGRSHTSTLSAPIKPVQSVAQEERSTAQRSGAQPLDIAIIGIAGRYPKARNLDELWVNLSQGANCVTEIPPERWSLDGFYDPERGRLGRSYTKWGGFIDGMDEFDPAFFGLSDLEAQIMDPQERLFLQCVHDTLEDAGYTRESILKQHQRQGVKGNVGVFVGTMYMEYQLHAAQAQERGEGFGLNGLAASMANRVSYAFNFQGPSLAVDAMCSASLTAIHLAAHSLLRGECEVAVAGGVNLNLHPNKFMVMSQGQFASSEGLCRSFGQGGDGYVASEGVGAVLLKPLAQAIADGDQVYAVIKGSALSHSGKTTAYTVPNPNAQAHAIKRAVQESGISPRVISYIEAHGTGTVLGDPIEIAALARVYGGAARDGMPRCPIGSVKSNLGHCESAGGMAGLTKVLLQMRYRQLVPSLHSQTLNSHIDFERAPFVVQQELADWSRPREIVVGGDAIEWPLTAGVSSYGAGGSNAHLIVQEYVDSRTTRAAETPSHSQAIVLSAKTEAALREAAQRLKLALMSGKFTDTDLADIAYTLQVGREAMPHRLAGVACSIDEACALLDAYLCDGRNAHARVVTGSVSRGRETLGMLHADGDLQDVMCGWASAGKLDKVIQLWVQGLSFDWAQIHLGSTARRISLPTYPFARGRYWMPKLSRQDIEAGLRVEGGAEIGAGTVDHVKARHQHASPDFLMQSKSDTESINL